VRLFPELEVDDEDLGAVEGDREPPPRQVNASRMQRLVDTCDPDRPHERAGEREDAVEDPDPTRRAKSLTHSDAERP
jgi:hypothetical protein